jgi:hypothetical protein
VSGTQQVGWAISGGQFHAGLWNGNAISWVDLGARDVYGTSGAQQVGDFFAGYPLHAGLWSGTAASRVDLNPGSAVHSVAYGVFGTQQVGEAAFNEDGVHAGLWNGTAASWVDLGYGTAYATSGTHQVGAALVASGLSHASLWSGTASLIDLNPAGATSSAAYGIFDTWQIGVVTLGGSSGSTNASLWSGTAASWQIYLSR